MWLAFDFAACVVCRNNELRQILQYDGWVAQSVEQRTENPRTHFLFRAVSLLLLISSHNLHWRVAVSFRLVTPFNTKKHRAGCKEGCNGISHAAFELGRRTPLRRRCHAIKTSHAKRNARRGALWRTALRRK
jgi:hypothetical protein